LRIRPRYLLSILAGSSVALGLLAVPAAAATTPAVTLGATPTTLAFGLSTTVYGHVTPRLRGQTVKVVDQDGHVWARPTTNAEGKYKTAFAPRKTVSIHAEWNGVKSASVRVRVRAVVRVGLGGVLLFGNAVAKGKVRPIDPGARVEVILVRGNTPVARRLVPMNRRGKFKTKFYVAKPGAYRARAVFDDDDHLPGKAVSQASKTPMPYLRAGSRGLVVFLLERRLVALHYRLAGVDKRFDFRTADAVMAFRKVQGLARVNTVDTKVWHKLAFPRHPKVRLKAKGRHVEVNQSLQVLYVVVDGKIAYIIHVSTGKPSTPTRDGSFRVWGKIAGYSGHHLYYPSYFDGQRAIHGWTEVPPYAASHGCVRIPYWNAIWMFGLDPIGTRVLVYH
jgi:lipoprotein-anchoring transpeptidase ErfK/SrfK